MTKTPSPSRRAFLAPLVALLGLGAIAIVYWKFSGHADLAIPRVDDIARLRIRLDASLDPTQDDLPPPFDVPRAHFPALLDRVNSARKIDVPATKLGIGHLEAWYRDGEGLRVEFFLIRTNDAKLTSKDLVLATPDGVWRRDGKFVDFADDVRNAYRDYQAEAR